MSNGPELWADRRPPDAETRRIEVTCEILTDGSSSCRPEAPVNADDETWEAYFKLKKYTSRIRHQKVENDDKTMLYAGTPAMAAIGITSAVATFGWYDILAGKAFTDVAAAGLSTAGVAAGAAVGIAAATFGPSQVAWNNEVGRLIEPAVEKKVTMQIEVVVDEGTPVPEEAGPKAGPTGVSPQAPPPNGYRTWREIIRGIRDKMRSLRERNFKEWFNSRQAKTVEKDRQETLKAPAKGKAKWFVKRIGKGLKEFFIDRGRYLKRSALDLKDVAIDLARHPVTGSLDVLNRPGKLFFYTSNGYAFLSLASAIWRRVTGASKINPLGSDIFPEDYEGVAEPVLGIYATASIAAAADHYLFGWRRASAIIYEVIIALYPYAVQNASGGSDRKSTDWNRAYLHTFTSSIIWGPIAAYRKVVNVGFPNITWSAYLARLEEKGGKTLPKLLNAIPTWLSPSIAPSKGNFLTYYSILTAHGYTVLSIDIISDNADFGERYSCYTAELSAFIFTRWFDMAFDPYSRPLMGAATGIFKIFVYREYSKYFQFYKGTKFYRNVLPGLAKDNMPYQDVIGQIDAMFTKKTLFGSENELVPEDLYDLYLDVAGGELTAREKEYLYDLVTKNDTQDPQYKRLKLALRHVFEKSYKSSDEFFAEVEAINVGKFDRSTK